MDNKNILTADEALKEISANKIYETEKFHCTALDLKAGAKLKEHKTPIPAFLICVQGKVVFSYNDGETVELVNGSYLGIEAGRIHSVTAQERSSLLLVR